MSSRRDLYMDAHRILTAAVREHDAAHRDRPANDSAHTVEIDMVSARDLLAGYPPPSDPYPASVSFCAGYVPFLRPALNPMATPSYRGITVLPHPDGGVSLFATDGRVMLLAHDATGHVSPGGCQVVLSRAALDACQPREPFKLWFDGQEETVAEAPTYARPSRVICLGAGVVVMPMDQPAGLSDPNNGGALYAALLEMDDWEGGNRLEPPLEWRGFEPKLNVNGPALRPCAVTAATQTLVAQAMAAADPDKERLVWDLRSSGELITYIPQKRPDLLIVIAGCRNTVEDPQIPKWVLRAMEKAEAPAQTQEATP